MPSSPAHFLVPCLFPCAVSSLPTLVYTANKVLTQFPTWVQVSKNQQIVQLDMLHRQLVQLLDLHGGCGVEVSFVNLNVVFGQPRDVMTHLITKSLRFKSTSLIFALICCFLPTISWKCQMRLL
jgi:hypothetical protein